MRTSTSFTETTPSRSTFSITPSRRVMRKSAPSPPRSTPLPPCSALSAVVSSTPPTVNTSFTATPVLLMKMLNVPANVTPGTLSSTVAVTVPARPAGVINSAPRPSLTRTKSVVPLPRRSETFAAATRTVVRATPPGVVGVLVERSKEKSPLRLWPAMVRLMFVPSTRRYGPAGKSTINVSPPTRMRSFTRAVVLLMARPSVPEKPISGIATVASMRPAMPAGVSTNAPSPPLSTTKSVVPSPMRRPTCETPMRTTRWPAAFVTCSKAKLPVRVWPRISSVAGWPTVRPATSTRTYGPAGRSRSITMASGPEPMVNVSSTRTLVLLIATVTLPSTVMPGSFTSISAESSPASPAEVIRKLPVPALTTTKSVVPSPRCSSTPLAAILMTFWPGALVTCSNEKLPVNVWPAMDRLIFVPSTRTYGPFGSTRLMGGTLNSSLTALPVLLIASEKFPANCTPGTFSDTVALN